MPPDPDPVQARTWKLHPGAKLGRVGARCPWGGRGRGRGGYSATHVAVEASPARDLGGISPGSPTVRYGQVPFTRAATVPAGQRGTSSSEGRAVRLCGFPGPRAGATAQRKDSPGVGKARGLEARARPSRRSKTRCGLLAILEGSAKVHGRRAEFAYLQTGSRGHMGRVRRWKPPSEPGRARRRHVPARSGLPFLPVRNETWASASGLAPRSSSARVPPRRATSPLRSRPGMRSRLASSRVPTPPGFLSRGGKDGLFGPRVRPACLRRRPGITQRHDPAPPMGQHSTQARPRRSRSLIRPRSSGTFAGGASVGREGSPRSGSRDQDRGRRRPLPHGHP